MTATDDAPAVGVDEQKLAEWRAMPLSELTDNSVIRHALAKHGVGTAGGVYAVLVASTHALPWGLTEYQAGHLCERLNAAGDGDPGYTPLAVGEVPADLFAGVES